jgi:uncharacterized protein YbjT (DUF2867 family)
MENILVAGATGTTGQKVINLLKKSQYFTPIAMVRREDQIPQFKDREIHTVLADLEKDVNHAFENIDKVVFAAGSKGKNVKAVDENGAKKMVSASKENKVKRFVMLSSMGADNPESHNELKDYLKAKQSADEFLRSSDVKYTIVRPGALTNDKPKEHIEIAKKLDQTGKISRADVAQVLVRSLHDTSPYNTTFEILEGEVLIGDALASVQN